MVCVGRLKDGPERQLVDDYPSRARRTGAQLGWREISEIEVASGGGMDREGERLLERVGDGVIIRLDPRTREITFEAWPRWIDPTAPDAACYEGWPVTVRQGDNAGGSWTWAVNSVSAAQVDRLVLTVRRPGADSPLYTIRVYDGFVPRVPDEGPWEWEYRDASTGDVFSVDRAKASRGIERMVCRDITGE